MIKKLIITSAISILLMTNLTFGQNKEISDFLNLSIASGKKAKELTTSSFDHMKQWLDAKPVNFKYYARMTRTAVDNGKNKIQKAETYLSDALAKADSINCITASNSIRRAIQDFDKARSEFGSAEVYIGNANGGAEDKADLENILHLAKNYIEEGNNYINSALKELNDAILKLDGCK